MTKDLKQSWQSFVAHFAIFSAAVIVFSFGALTSYYSGYLDYFGINIRYVDFWPHLPDFMVVAVPILIAMLVVSVLSYIAMRLLNALGGWISRKYKNKILSTIGEALQLDKNIVLVVILISMSAGAFNIVYGSQVEDGAGFASGQTRFIRVGPDSQRIDLLIYQNGGTAFTKTYDKKSKQFDSGYNTVNFIGQNLEQIEIKKK